MSKLSSAQGLRFSNAGAKTHSCMPSKARTNTSLHAPRREIVLAMERLEEEPEHVCHVAMLALQIFDDVADWHGLTARDRLLLEAGSSLHDIGWSLAPGGAKHHKHSARLIRKQRWRHFNRSEVEIIALVARYHRRSIPKARHREFRALSKADRRRVCLLAAMLRIADGLDRRHLQSVSAVRTRMTHVRIIFDVTSSKPLTIEKSACEKKGDLFRKLTGRMLLFRWTGLGAPALEPVTPQAPAP